MAATKLSGLAPGRRRLRSLASGALLAVLLSGGAAYGSPRTTQRSATQGASIRLSGAGSTFDEPFFAAAFARYHKLNPKVSIRYAAVGSGIGIKDFSAGQVNFGASDVPMSPAEQSGAKGGPLIQVPVDLGAVVVSYNIPYFGSHAAPTLGSGARSYLPRSDHQLERSRDPGAESRRSNS